MKKEKKFVRVENPDRISSYFKQEKLVLAVITVTGILYNIGMAAGPYFEGRLAQCLYDIIGGTKTFSDMLSLALVYVLTILFVQANRAVKRFATRRFGNNISRSMRCMIYNSIVHETRQSLHTEQMGSLMTKAISDVDACAEGMRKFTTEIFDTGVVLVVYLVMLLTYDWRLALLSCLFIPAAYVIADRLKGVVTRYTADYKKQAGKLNQTTMDLTGNELLYRTSGLEEHRREAYEKSLTAYEKSAVRANVWISALQPVYYVIAMCGTILIFTFGSRNIRGTGWTVWDIGAFTTFLSCFTKLAVKASKSAKLFNAVQKAAVSWKRVKPMMKEYREDTADSAQAAQVSMVEFKDASLNYPGAEVLVSGINFTASSGQIIGVTGEVACGKTAVGKLFVGETLYTGSILIYEKDTSGNTSVRELVALTDAERNTLVTYMGHDPELLSADIAENILLKEAENGTDEENVREALKTVSLEQEVQETEKGIRTEIGNGGTRLSGGQQDRLALARTLTHAKEILVLDDPFSAVDKKTEKEIFERLKEISDNRIILLISHRLALFPELSGVLYLQDGRASFGTHAALIDREPGYAALVSRQFDDLEGGTEV